MDTKRTPWRAWLIVGVVACAGCRAAYAQSAVPPNRSPRVAQQYFDAGIGRLDAARDATTRDATVDVVNDVERDTSPGSRDAGRPPLTIPNRPPTDRPIGGGPNEGPQEPIPIDDAGRSPLR